MGLFDAKLPPQVSACDKELAALEQRRREIYFSIGQRYASEITAQQAAGTPYESYIQELEKIAGRSELLGKRRLAVQGQRKCEKCGNILNLDSAFCNRCGEKLLPIEPEVMTDGPLCPKCKAPVEPGVAFCTRCGERLADSAQPATAGTMVSGQCPECGTAYQPGTKFCMKCGRKLEG